MARTNERNFLAVLSSNAIATGIGFVVNIIIARSLPVQAYGVFGTLAVILSMLPMILDMGLGTAIVRFACVEDDDSRAVILNSVNLFKFCAGLFLTLLSIACAKPLSNLLFNESTYTSSLRIVFIGAFFQQLAFTFQSFLQTRPTLTLYTSFNLLPAAVKLLLFATAVTFGVVTLKLAMVFFSICSLVAFVWGIFLFRERLRLQFDRDLLKKLLLFSRWVAVSTILSVVLTRVDIFMLNKLADKLQLGYYYAAFQLAFVFPIITMSLTNTLLPKVSALSTVKQQREYVRRIVRFAPLVAVGYVLVAEAAQWLLPLCFGARYQQAVMPFICLLSVFMLGMIITPLGMIVYPLNKPHLHVYLFGVQIAVNIAVDYLMIPGYGAVGAAMGTVAAKLLGALMICTWIWRHLYGRTAVVAPD